MAEDIRNMASTAGSPAFEKKYVPSHCILLDSTYCSMGRMIGNIACSKSGYRYYDAVILLEEVPEENLTKDEVDAFEMKLRKEMSKEEILADPEYQRISAVFDKAIDKALAKGPCLIHDRATQEMIRAKGYSSVKVLLYATNEQDKIERAKLSPVYSSLTNDAKILEGIDEEDMIRRNYHKTGSDTPWGVKETYDLCINSDELGRDYAGWLLAQLMTGEK